jgi:hypothetical protein
MTVDGLEVLELSSPALSGRERSRSRRSRVSERLSPLRVSSSIAATISSEGVMDVLPSSILQRYVEHRKPSRVRNLRSLRFHAVGLLEPANAFELPAASTVRGEPVGVLRYVLTVDLT